MWGSDPAPPAPTEAAAKPAGLFFFHLDHLSTPQMMTDENGEVVWQADYLPFGGVNVTVDAAENRFRFPGQYYDAETGLHYNYHRYYDPKTGRYLMPDPIGLAGMDPNLYGYVLNDPINAIDPLGLSERYRFDAWVEVTYKHGIAHYKRLYAQCIRKKEKKCFSDSDDYEIKQVFVTFEQYSPIRIGVPGERVAGLGIGNPSNPNPPRAVDSAFDIFEASQEAKKWGAFGRIEQAKYKDGQIYCDSLMLP